MDKYDLTVIGGGFAGTAAAISAAVSGLNVLLIEKSNCLGGAAVNGLVNPFMPYWTDIYENNNKSRLYLNRGIFKDILNALASFGALDKNEMTFNEEYLKLILNRMVKKERIDILFHSYLTDTSKDNETIKSVTVVNKSGKMTFEADYFIDATGDADLSVLCGCPYRLGREPDGVCQPMTLCFRVANVDKAAYAKSKPKINVLYNEMQKQGKIKNIRENVLIFDNLINGVLHFNSTRIIRKNPVDAFDVTEAEIEAREQAFELFNFLVENIDGFQNSQLSMTAMETGVRESRMINGKYLLTGDDVINCKKFDDSIAAGNYDIDIHNPDGSGTDIRSLPKGEYYTIPYRSLIPIGVNNLLVAGRCMSATHEAQASIRIMPIVCCIGEAAGVAAHVAHENAVGFNDVDVDKVQEILKKRGAVI